MAITVKKFLPFADPLVLISASRMQTRVQSILDNPRLRMTPTPQYHSTPVPSGQDGIPGHLLRPPTRPRFGTDTSGVEDELQPVTAAHHAAGGLAAGAPAAAAPVPAFSNVLHAKLAVKNM